VGIVPPIADEEVREWRLMGLAREPHSERPGGEEVGEVG